MGTSGELAAALGGRQPMGARGTARGVLGQTLLVLSVWLVGLGVMVGGTWVGAQEPVPDQYTLTIHYPGGQQKTLKGVESHQLISEKGATFLSVILKDGRRFLFSVEGREFEFSPEMGQILQAEARKSAGARSGDAP